MTELKNRVEAGNYKTAISYNEAFHNSLMAMGFKYDHEGYVERNWQVDWKTHQYSQYTKRNKDGKITRAGIDILTYSDCQSIMYSAYVLTTDCLTEVAHLKARDTNEFFEKFGLIDSQYNEEA